MPTYEFIADIELHRICSPGTLLPNEGQLYIVITAFNSVRRSRLVDPVFPVTLHQRFHFKKVFIGFSSEEDILDVLSDLPVVIEFWQLTDRSSYGTLLAVSLIDAYHYFAPYLLYESSNRGSDRELILDRTEDFMGLPPRLEFSSYVSLNPVASPRSSRSSNSAECRFKRNQQPSIDKNIIRCKKCNGVESSWDTSSRDDYESVFMRPSYERPTVTTALKCRSHAATDRETAKSHVMSDYFCHKERRRGTHGKAGGGSERVDEYHHCHRRPSDVTASSISQTSRASSRADEFSCKSSTTERRPSASRMAYDVKRRVNQKLATRRNVPTKATSLSQPPKAPPRRGSIETQRKPPSSTSTQRTPRCPARNQNGPKWKASQPVQPQFYQGFESATPTPKDREGHRSRSVSINSNLSQKEKDFILAMHRSEQFKKLASFWDKQAYRYQDKLDVSQVANMKKRVSFHKKPAK